jgi:hypothetical protein
MLAAAGKMVQLANKEYHRWKNYTPPEFGKNYASAFARAKCNQDDAYAAIHQIKARSQEICKTDLQLLAEEQATQQNTTAANALKAILKCEHGHQMTLLTSRTPPGLHSLRNRRSSKLCSKMAMNISPKHQTLPLSVAQLQNLSARSSSMTSPNRYYKATLTLTPSPMIYNYVQLLKLWLTQTP